MYLSAFVVAMSTWRYIKCSTFYRAALHLVLPVTFIINLS